MLRGVRVRVKVTNRPPQKHEGALIVSNHMGFVDILMLASLAPVSFITSHEMRETFFLGPITEMAGCFYVERRSRTKILEEMKSLARNLKEGLN
ncbi:MAG: 1-acyl-sn-glycerol-3-phosphate acyltransferase, partial [Bdellovibrio sp.]|nr:1-acyl-sn-glycerol-3-phosphate acyltransferase [Bdellovibrio sp.]